MHVPSIIKQAQGLVTQNAPAILTGVGVVGVVGTAYLTGRATFRAAEVLRDEQHRLNVEAISTDVEYELTALDKAKLIWTLYLPAAGVASSTIVAIVYANRINAKRMAALLTAYAGMDKAYSEYKDKVKEHLTGPKEQKIRDEIAQDNVHLAGEAGFFFANPLAGKVWIMEAYTGRPFLSTVEDVNRAANEVNAVLNGPEGSVRLSDFYDRIGLEHVATSDYFGFTRDDQMALDWSTTTSPDGSLAVHVFDYQTHPVQDPERHANPFR